MHRLLARVLLRRQLRSVVALGLLCGVVAGVGLWGLAAARRTSSTFERYLDRAHASHLSVNVNTFEQAVPWDEQRELMRAGSELPGVEETASYIGLESMALPTDVEGAPNPPEFVGSIDGRFLDQDKVAVVEGRLPRPDRADEMFVDEVASRNRDLEVGDVTTIFVADQAALQEGRIEEVGRFEAEVVGIGVFAEDVLEDDYDQLGRVLLTPAATERWIEVAGSYVWHGLRLADPSAVGAVIAAYRGLVTEDAYVNTLVTAELASDVQRAQRPLIAALAAFGATALVAALALGTIAAGRLARSNPEVTVLRAIGVGPRALQVVTSAPAVAAGVLASAVGVGTAIALSPLAPVGSIRDVEPARGIDADGLVLPLGAAVVLAALVVAALVASLRVVRPRPRSVAGARRRTRTLPLSAPSALGVRRGLGSGTASGAPVRAALVGIGISVVTVAGAITFGASLDTLASEPARYGWATDLALVAGSGYDDIDPAKLERLLGDDERVEGVTLAGFSGVELGGTFVPGTALHPVRGEVPVTVLDGRAPEADDEVALGRRTASRLGVGPGDEVEGPGGTLSVTGIVAFPAIGQATSSHPGMGDGALFTGEGLDPTEAQASIAYLDLAAGVDPVATGFELASTLVDATNGGFLEPEVDLRPAELDGAEDATGTVGAVAAVVGVAAVLGLAAVVLASVGGRRRELAILRALGFTSRDLRRSVRWQAATLALAALVVGVPLGVAGGRLVWREFAEVLGVDPTPTVPVLALALLSVGTAVLAVVVAQPAARRAARLPAAAALHPE